MGNREGLEKDLIERAIELLNEEFESSPDFNEYFDGDEPLRLGKLELRKSKVLFWFDPPGYQDEQLAWKNQSLQETHQSCFDLLTTGEQLPQFRELSEAVARKRIVPFVGAGLSQAMDMPLWGAAMRKLHGRIHNPLDPIIASLIDEGRYLEAAQELAHHSPVIVNNFIRTTYRVQKVAGPVQALPKIAHGCIVTTNFDDAIEEAFKREGMHFDGYMHGTQQHNFFSRLVRGQRCLLKLHGDADDSQTYILTKDQYLEAYDEPFDFRKPLPKALRQIFVSNSLLFLGCSLEQDWTLELFKQVIERAEYEIPNHFAILPRPNDPHIKQQKEAALLEVSIQPIWYPAGEHDYVEKLLSFLLDVAEKRIGLNAGGAAV